MNIKGFFILTLLTSGLLCSTSGAENITQKSQHSGFLVERIEAIVNKKAIYYSDLKKFRTLIPLRVKVDPLFTNDPLSKKTPEDREIVDYLISESLILDQFPVSDQDLDQEINGIQNNLRINRQGLKDAISREGYQFEDYLELMRSSIAKRQLIDREIRNKASVTEDELKAEYNRSKSGSKSFQGSLKLQIIRVSKKDAQSMSSAKEKYQQILKDLSSGSPFEEVAKKSSDDPSSVNGGDLGFVSFQDMNSSFQSEAQKIISSKLPLSGQLGKTEDSQGFSIFRILEISRDSDSRFEKEKEPIRARLLEREFQNQIRIWIDRQKNLNHIRINHQG